MKALNSVMPECARVVRPSTSFGLRNKETGQAFPSAGGLHTYMLLAQQSDAPRFIRALHKRSWLKGHGWGVSSACGSFLERSIVDTAVASPERLIFEGRPVLEAPLEQIGREAIAYDGPLLDSVTACPDLTAEEEKLFDEAIAAEKVRLLPEMQRKRSEWSTPRIAAAMAAGSDEKTARRLVDAMIDGAELSETFVLEFDSLGLVDVGTVLGSPTKFDGATLADPHEGAAYGRGKAQLYVNGDGSVVVNSFAHGGKVYRLVLAAIDDDAPRSYPEPIAPLGYPVAALGPIMEAAAADIARRFQVPVALSAQSVLGAAALAVQAHADVMMPYNQTRPLSLYLASICESGERKSSSDNDAMPAVDAFEKMLAIEFEEKKIDYDIAMAAWTVARKEIEKERNVSPAERVGKLKAHGPPPDAPLSPRVRSGDATIEGLTKRAPTLRGSLGLYSNEGGSILCGYGWSQEQKKKTSTLLCKAWDGQGFDRLRADEDEIHRGRRLSMHVMVQPRIARILTEDDDLRDQGLLSRILIVQPKSMIGTREYEHPGARTSDLVEFDRVITRLLTTKAAAANSAGNILTPRPLMISEEALPTWIEFQNLVEADLGKDCPLAMIRDFGSKAGENAARIAGILAMIANPTAVTIGAAEMIGATELMGFYIGEALRLASNGKVEGAEVFLDWLRHQSAKCSNGRVPRGTISSFAPYGFREKGQYEPIVAFLIERGFIRETAKRELVVQL